MALDVESVWAALTERLEQKLTDVKSVARRPKAQYVADELPVIVIRDDDGTEDLLSDPDDTAPIWRLSGDVWIMARTVETDASPTTQLNALVKAVREALEYDAAIDGYPLTHYTTLGGLVRVLAIQKVEKGMGARTGLPTAQMTITMEAPERA